MMLAQVLRSRGMTIAAAAAVAVIACVGLAGLGLAGGAGPARAAAACPTVSAAGKVTPAPAPHVNWAGCQLGNANLSHADLASAQLGRATLSGANLADANLAGAGLTNAELSGANLSGAAFADANLSQAGLWSVNLAGAKLAGANLDGATSSDIAGVPQSLPAHWHLLDGYLLGPGASMVASPVDLAGADLAGYDLAGAQFRSADLTGADLAGANLTGVYLDDAALGDADLSGATMTGAGLAGVSSGGVTGSATTVLPQHWTLLAGYLMGPGTDLAPADLAGLNLAGVDLASASLGQADLSGAELAGADLTGINSWDLTGIPASLPANWFIAHGQLMGPGADLSNSSLGDLNLAGADLAGANLSGSVLSGADLAHANLAHASLRAAVATNADLTSADLASAGLDGADLADAVLTSADLDGADLTGADLAGATLTGATAAAATWHQTTCPNGLSSNRYVAGCLSHLDTTPPTVTVTGVANGHTYLLGYVPRASCRTTDNGTVATGATPSVTPTGANRVGRHTATCAGAVDLAGNKQAAPVRVSYTVIYGMSGFLAPRPGTAIARSSRVIIVRFRLFNADRKPLTGAAPAELAAQHRLRVTLRGPGIAAATGHCQWNAAHGYLTCAVKMPGGVRTGTKARYTITAYENLGAGFVLLPGPWGVIGTEDPETVHFR